MGESRIVWLRDPTAFPWVRVIEAFTTSREGWAKRWMPEGEMIIGYAELGPDVASVNRRFRRRVFHVRCTDYPFGSHYQPQSPGRPCEAVDPMTLKPNFDGELTDRSYLPANIAIVNEERLSTVQYETLEGRAYLVLARGNNQSETDKCPFCGRRHSHGLRDGHRVAHCAGKVKPFVTALDGTRLYAKDGYLVQTISQREQALLN